jgi:GT2 family glycosyltransferase
VLVLIVNYRLADHIERLLASACLVPHRVLLVDNASQPERLRQIAGRFGTELLLLDRNYGFAGAVNRALAQATPASTVLLLNPDVHMGSGTLDALRRALADDRGLTGVTPLLLNGDGSRQVGTAGGPPSVAGFFSYFCFVSHLLPRTRGVMFTRRQLASGLTPSWLCMACLLVRGDAFSRFGPVPEFELAYAEDVAWGVAASAAGARFAVLPRVTVVHEQGAAGESARWKHALARLAVREAGLVRGCLARVFMEVGLGVRALVGHVPGVRRRQLGSRSSAPSSGRRLQG